MPSPLTAVITAGGTAEPIDDVRVVTNLSTGRFGAALAHSLARRGVKVTLLASRALASHPDWVHPDVEIRPFGSFRDLDEAMHQALRDPPDMLFMAAAVSDYAPVPAAGKIRSHLDELVVRMVRNPKLLSTLRERCGPDTFLCGFKLLSGVAAEELIAVGREQLTSNQLDLCFANDLAELKGGQHPAWLVSAEGPAQRLQGTKAQAAEALATHVLTQLRPQPPAPPRYAPWIQRLKTTRAAGRWRSLRTLTPTGPTTAELEGRPVIVACSNDYLGLAAHPEVQAAARGGGAGGSRLISGSRPVHQALEQALEDWLGRPALLFPSGWQANQAVFSTLCEAHHTVASDTLNHASIIDGLRLSRATRLVLPHATPQAVPEHTDLLVLEGLYSMDGDVPPFAAYPRAPWLAVDEAHALGCLGPEGRGAAAAAGITPDVLIGTFGKAFGASGAFVCGPQALKDLLINAGRSFIFTTALPEPVAHMALAGLRAATAARRERLYARTRRLRAGLRQLGWRPLGEAHIVPLVVGPRAMELSDHLLRAGIFAPGIRYPTVPRGQERVRFTVSSEHTPEQLDRILSAIGPEDTWTP